MFKLLSYKNEIASETDGICGLISGILGFIAEVKGQIDPCTEFELKVILNELILNAIKHGNNCDPIKKVKTSVTIIKNGYIVILVEDEGEGYDYNQTCSCATDDLFELKETGRGIFIVSNLCDRIKFNKKGNKVIVLKKI